MTPLPKTVLVQIQKAGHDQRGVYVDDSGRYIAAITHSRTFDTPEEAIAYLHKTEVKTDVEKPNSRMG